MTAQSPFQVQPTAQPEHTVTNRGFPGPSQGAPRPQPDPGERGTPPSVSPHSQLCPSYGSSILCPHLHPVCSWLEAFTLGGPYTFVFL